MQWIRIRHNGIYQLVSITDTFDGFETHLDVTDGKCRELWRLIKKDFPQASGYRNFCRAYREGKKEWEDYCERDERRYRAFWGNRR